jgi:hypothetical protein
MPWWQCKRNKDKKLLRAKDICRAVPLVSKIEPEALPWQCGAPPHGEENIL